MDLDIASKRVNWKRFSLFELSTYRTEIYGLSIFWIMLFHSFTIQARYPGKINFFISYGNIGCEIFLAMSAMCLYFSFIKDGNLNHFVKKRLIRLIFPVVIICYPYWIFNYFEGVYNLKALSARMACMNFWFKGDQQIWFVSFLFVAYLLYPYFFYLIFDDNKRKFKRELVSCVILMFITFCLLYIMMKHSPSQYKMWEIGLNRINIFIMGCLLGKYVYNKKEISIWWLAVCLFLGGLFFVGMRCFNLSGIIRRQWYLVGGIPFAFLMARLFHCFKDSRFNKFFAFLGSMSLELYLAHIMLIRLYKSKNFILSYTPGSILDYVLILLCSVPIAFVAMKLSGYISKLLKKQFNI